MSESPLRNTRRILLAGVASIALSGCTLMVAAGDVDMEAAEKTTARDHDARMTRLRDNGTLNETEHQQLSQKMGYQSGDASLGRPSIEELERRVEADRKAAARAKAQK